MNEEEAAYITKLENAIQTRTAEQSLGHANSVFNANQNVNLIEFQLELDNILERIDHLLRGHELKFDEEGNLKWESPRDKSHEIFNEYGVQEILRVLSMYLNRNTILSNYDEETINWKIYDLGLEITDLIFMKYDEMFQYQKFKDIYKKHYEGMEKTQELIKEIEERSNEDRLKKIKLYPIVVRQIIDAVHSSYLRALEGGERESLRTARSVTQTEPLANMNPMATMNQQKKFSLFKPSTWNT